MSRRYPRARHWEFEFWCASWIFFTLFLVLRRISTHRVWLSPTMNMSSTSPTGSLRIAMAVGHHPAAITSRKFFSLIWESGLSLMFWVSSASISAVIQPPSFLRLYFTFIVYDFCFATRVFGERKEPEHRSCISPHPSMWPSLLPLRCIYRWLDYLWRVVLKCSRPFHSLSAYEFSFSPS